MSKEKYIIKHDISSLVNLLLSANDISPYGWELESVELDTDELDIKIYRNDTLFHFIYQF